MSRQKCDCPIYCKYCGRMRRKDYDGTHWCPTQNCQWQHGYAGCKATQKRAGAAPPVEEKKP
jgi:hypothetical protein